MYIALRIHAMDLDLLPPLPLELPPSRRPSLHARKIELQFPPLYNPNLTLGESMTIKIHMKKSCTWRM